MNNKRLEHSKLRILLLLILLLLALPSAGSAESERRAKVGMLLTLTGSFSTAGEDCRKGIEAALVDSGQAEEFELVYADSKNEPSNAVSEFRKLTQLEGAVAIYTHRSSMGMALNPIAKTHKVPLLGAVGHKDFAAQNQYAFQVWPATDQEGFFVAEEFLRNFQTRAAMIYTEDDWTGAIADGFRQKYNSIGGTLVFDESVLPQQRDFRTLLTKLKNKDAQVIYLNVLLPQIGPLIRQARELGLNSQLFSNFYTSRSDVLDSAGVEALEGVRYVEMDTNLPSLRAHLGLQPTASPQGLTVASYVATMLLAQAVASMEGPISAQEFYNALLEQSAVKTPDHNFEIIDRRIQFPLTVKEITEGSGRGLKASKRSFGKDPQAL